MADTLADGLIAHWSFSNNLEDSSGNNRTLLVGTSSNFATDKDGNANSCMGADSRLGLDEKLILNTDNESFSYTIWFEKNTNPNVQVLIGNGTYTWGGCYVQQQSGNIDVTTDASQHRITAVSDLSDGWHLISVKYSANNLKCKIDNILKVNASPPISTPRSSYTKFAVGCYTDRMSYPWKSKFDEARVYNRVLTDEEETLIYERGVGDITPPSFNSISIDTITYNSANLNVSSNETGIVYYKIVARNTTAPTSEEIKANPTGQANVIANTTSIQSITSLNANTQYDLYVVAEGTAGNIQTKPTKLSINTTQMSTQVMLQNIVTYIKAQIDNHPSGLAKSIQSWNVDWTMEHSPTAFETTVCNEWLGAKLGQAYTYDIALAILFLNSAKSMGYDVAYKYITGIADGAIEAINSNNGIVPFSYILYPNGVYECSGNFTGASAWLGLALSKLSYIDIKYRTAAENIFNSIYTLQNTFNIDDTSILIKGGVGKNWTSTEHNIDFWYLSNSLYKITKDVKYKNIRDKIKNGILKNWDDTNKVFKRGYNDDVKALDCASWGSTWLYNIGDIVKGTQCLSYASNFACISTNYSSITGYNRGEEAYNSNSVWVEGSAGVAYSKMLYAQDYSIDLLNQEKLYELADYYFLYSSDTYEILDDSMLRAPAIASYGWMGLVYLAKPDAFCESPDSSLEKPKDPKSFFWERESAVEYRYIQPPKIIIKNNIVLIQSQYKIYYTTDCSYPNNTSLQYTKPFILPQNTHTITAIAWSESNASFSYISQQTLPPPPPPTIFQPQ